MTNTASKREQGHFHFNVSVCSRRNTVDALDANEIETFVEKIRSGELSKTEIEKIIYTLAQELYSRGWRDGFGDIH